MKIENLTFSYGENQIFNNFNLDIENNKTTAILGKSGVGKTTLLKIISGLIETEHKHNEPVAFAFQEDRLIPHLTVKQNLTLVTSSEQEITNYLKECDLLDKINAYPSKLSGGEKQRLNLIRAFLSNRKVILLDEPFSSLDLHLKLKLISQTITMQEKTNSTLVFVTHDIEEALLLSHRVVVIDNGKIKLDLMLDNSPKNRSYGSLNSERQKIIEALI